MAEYVAKCRIISTDAVTAAAEDGEIILTGTKAGKFVMDACVRPDDARTFARGLLALADEVDGGEAPEPAPVKVGDRVEILPSVHNPSSAGRVGIVKKIDALDDDDVPYLIGEEGTGRFIAWAALVRRVDAPADTRPKVGDRLRVTENYPWAAPAKTNDVITVVETAYDREDGSEDGVRFRQDGDSFPWHVPLSAVEGPLAEWEVDLLTASEPEPAPVPCVPVVPMRGAFVEHAKRLLADDEHTAVDIIRLAEFLAGE
ncbi:hypothetical protein [Streptomyces sp. NPDC059753]|uniref:hypothetical protein n=1 Tax=Streptomyces sp. NPDC059753 TaxID=3346933 RepID=UPI003646D9B5